MGVVSGTLQRIAGLPDAVSGFDPVSDARGQAFRDQEARGLVLAFWARTIAVALIAVFLTYTIQWPRTIYYLSWVGAFFLLGLIPYWLRRTRFWRSWLTFVFTALDIALITAVILVPAELSDQEWPVQTRTRFPDFLYLLLYLAGSTLSFSPLVVWVTGLSVAAIWSMGVLLIYTRPETVTFENAAALGLPTDSFGGFLQVYLHPTFVSFNTLLTQVVATLLITYVLGAAIARARAFMTRQIDAELERQSLSRFFSPDVISRISNVETIRTGGRTHDAAVLFVDIVGFTGMSESLGPDRTIHFLREFHERMADTVFVHSGTLDKYLGDGLMATFGTFESSSDDARRALRCALDMVDEVEEWNLERERQGEEAVRIAVGVHYGPVIAGDVGNGRRIEFTVVGDSVNVASRLERLSREHDTPVAISGELARAAEVDGERAVGSWRLEPRGSVSVRGRRQPLDLWVACERQGADA